MTLPTPLRFAALLSLTATLLAPSAAASAQEFRGRLVQQGSGSPVPGALVRLLDATGGERDAALTDSAGRFGVTSDTTGTHRLAVERIGYRTWRSDSFRLDAGTTRSEVVHVAVEPVRLAEIRAEGERRCRIRPREGEALSRIWEEARKALDRERRTREDGTLRLHLRTWERVLGPDHSVLSEDVRSKWKRDSRSYVSRPAEELLSEGFVQRRDDGLHFFGPDAEVLLSEAFRETHCFRLVPPESSAGGRLGVAFEPVEGRAGADVEGVLWLDPESAELRHLEFRYTDHGLSIPEGSARGRVEFEALPTGQWVVRRWWIRWPEVVEEGAVGARGVSDQGAYRFERRLKVTRYGETGGELLAVDDGEPESDTEVADPRPRGATLTGTVYDSLRGEPLPGAIVRLVGTGHETETDDRGWFALEGVPPGRYRLGFRHPDLAGVDERVTGASVEVRRGAVYTTRLAGPGPEAMRGLLCSEAEADTLREREKTGVVAGLVHGAGEDGTAPGAPVRLSWRDAAPAAARAGREAGAALYRAEVEADSAGRFVACGVPLDRNVRVSVARREGREVRLTADEPVRIVRLPGAPGPEVARREARPGAGTGGSVLAGTVRGRESGEALAGAGVRLLEGERTTVTGVEGRFTFEGLAAGRHRLVVEHLGRTSDTVAVTLEEEARSEVRMTLGQDPVRLSGLEVSVERTVRDSDLRGYFRRMEAGNGRFVEGREVERDGLIGALRRVPNLQVQECRRRGLVITGCYRLTTVSRGSTMSLNLSCSPTLYLDGSRIGSAGEFSGTALDALRSLPRDAIEGIEVHGPSTVPPRFGGAGGSCGVVLVWTKR